MVVYADLTGLQQIRGLLGFALGGWLESLKWWKVLGYRNWMGSENTGFR